MGMPQEVELGEHLILYREFAFGRVEHDFYHVALLFCGGVKDTREKEGVRGELGFPRAVVEMGQGHRQV